MNKKNKGFTLVELLGVIVVLAIIIAIAVPTFGKISTSISQKQYENKLKLIEAAALKFADDTNYVAFYISDLVENGYLDPDRDRSVYDNRDNSTKMDCYPIMITEEKGINYATIEEKNHEDGNKCDTNYLASHNDYFTIMVKPTNDVEKELTKDSWFKDETITVKLSPKDNTTINSRVWYTGLLDNVGTGVEEFTIQTANSIKNEIYRVKANVTKNGKTRDIETSFVIQIDRIKPYLKRTDNKDSLNTSYSQTKTYSPEGADNESGYYGAKLIKIAKLEEDGTLDDYTGYTCQNGKDISTESTDYVKGKPKYTITTNGIYKLCLKDNVGNENYGLKNKDGSEKIYGTSDSSNLITDLNSNENKDDKTLIGIDKIDTKPPYCDQVEPVMCKVDGEETTFECSGDGTSDRWVKNINNIKAYLPCFDQKQRSLDGGILDGSGCAKDFYEVTPQPDTTNPGTYKASADLYDKVGNKTTTPCVRGGLKINIDGEAPDYKIEVSDGRSFTQSINGATFSQNKTARITIYDKPNGSSSGIKEKDKNGNTIQYKFKYAWSTSAKSCNNISNDSSFIITKQSNGVYYHDLTIPRDPNSASKPTDAATLYVCNMTEISDNADNVYVANQLKSVAMYLDNTPPEIVISPDGEQASNNVYPYAKIKSVTVTIKDITSGLASGNSMQYAWSTSNTIAPTAWTTATLSSYTEGTTGNVTFTASGKDLSGAYYLWIHPVTLKDRAENTTTANAVSKKPYYFDNSRPSCSWGNWSAATLPTSSGAYKSTITLTCTDSHSGVPNTSKSASVNNTKLGTVSTPTMGGTTASRTFTYTFEAKNQVSGKTKIKIQKSIIADVATNKWSDTSTDYLESPVISIVNPAKSVSVVAIGVEKGKENDYNPKNTGTTGIGGTTYILATEESLDENYNYFEIGIRARFVGNKNTLKDYKNSTNAAHFVCHLAGSAVGFKCGKMVGGSDLTLHPLPDNCNPSCNHSETDNGNHTCTNTCTSSPMTSQYSGGVCTGNSNFLIDAAYNVDSDSASLLKLRDIYPNLIGWNNQDYNYNKNHTNNDFKLYTYKIYIPQFCKAAGGVDKTVCLRNRFLQIKCSVQDASPAAGKLAVDVSTNGSYIKVGKYDTKPDGNDIKEIGCRYGTTDKEPCD